MAPRSCRSSRKALTRMPAEPTDVIVAVAAGGRADALALLRFSGQELRAVLSALVRPMGTRPLVAGQAPRRVEVLANDTVIDDGLIWIGRAPQTYTGEPTAELTVHGNPLVVDQILDAARQAGARLAEPGEFTRRAVVHGKMDLVQAEAVLQVAEARSSRGLQLARQALQGELSREFEQMREPLLDVAAELEARLDLGHDDLVMMDDQAVCACILDAEEQCLAAARTHRAAHAWVHGARVALVGPVNAGKSSLFNALLGRRRALVHESAGTTRDVLEQSTVLDGLPVTLLDTAGDRHTTDPVEQAGLALAGQLIEDADLWLWVSPVEGPEVPAPWAERMAHRPHLKIANGVDRAEPDVDVDWLLVSAQRGDGLAELRVAIRQAVAGDSLADRSAVASRRQADALMRAAQWLAESRHALGDAGPAVAAQSMTEALVCIDSLVGIDTREEVLSRLFQRFCIGK